MRRRGSLPKPWKPRLSAGGANRTNLTGVMNRIRDRNSEASPSRHQDHSDLMPGPRASHFRPFNSRLHPQPQRHFQHYQEPPRYHPQFQQAPPLLPSLPQYPLFMPPQYHRSEAQEAPKRQKKSIPRRGMFLNAKYSEAPPPEIDEDQIRQTEEVITRMIEKSRQKGYHEYHRPPNYAMRDSIRRAVWNAGVPDNYRLDKPSYNPEPRYEEEEDDEEEDSEYEESRRRQRLHKDSSRRRQRHLRQEEDVEESRRRHHQKKARRRRHDYHEEDGEDSEEEPEPRKRPRRPEYEEEDSDEDRLRPSSSSKKLEKREKRKRRMTEKEANTSDEEAFLMERSRSSNASKASKRERPSAPIPEERAPSRGSKSSKNSTPRFPSPVSGPYIKDSDEDDNWRNSLEFMCKPNGAGAAMLERIGSAIQSLPLRDDTKNSYSDVAMMVLGKSLKKLENRQQSPQPQDEEEDHEDLQSQFLNRSTAWARAPKSTTTTATNSSLMREISRIQHPDNISTLQIDQSIFTAPRLLDIDKAVEKDWPSRRRQLMPPPRYQSSPISNDIFRISDNNQPITAPSSIRKGSIEKGPSLKGPITQKGPEDYGIVISDDDDDGFDPKGFDIDDYIAQGASQLNASYFPADPDISFYASNSNNNDIFGSSKSPENLPGTSREFEIETSGANNTTMDFNSLMYSNHSSRRKKKPVDPMLEIDESTQRMFDEVYENEKAEREKYLF